MVDFISDHLIAFLVLIGFLVAWLIVKLGVAGGITEQLTQGLAGVGIIPISNHATGSDRSIAGVDMSVLLRMLTIIDAGLVQGTVSCWYEASANSNMNPNTNMGNATGGSFINAAAVNNMMVLHECRKDQMPAGTRYLRPVLGVTTATANVAVLVFCDTGSYRPANQFNVTNVINTASSVY